jgi:poly(beta-D-mannuronate) lyase
MTYAGTILEIPEGKKENPTELDPPRQVIPWFVLLDAGGLRFRATCGGVTTSGSEYARCELKEKTYWFTGDGRKHVLKGWWNITDLPARKRHGVVAQIHTGKKDICQVRLEDRHLFVEHDGEEVGTLTDNYERGTKFRLKIKSGNGYITVRYGLFKTVKYYVGNQRARFKCGAYVQANTKTDRATDYLQVVIDALHFIHK